MKLPTSTIIVVVNTAILLAVNTWTYARGGSLASYSLIWEAIVISASWFGTVAVAAVTLCTAAIADKTWRPQIAPFARGFVISLPVLLLAFLPAWGVGMQIGGKLSGY